MKYALLAGAALAFASFGLPAAAQDHPKIGVLRCEVSSSLGLIITSSQEMECRFTAANGYSEPYFGKIRKFGLDIGATSQGTLTWDVLSATEGPRKGALAGDYGGVSASATAGAGVGANALIGGSDRAVTLQPVSVQTQTGLNLSAGVASMTLRSGS